MKIPIKKHIDDPSLTWEERYKSLEAHHLEETAWLIKELKKARLLQHTLCKLTVPKEGLKPNHIGVVVHSYQADYYEVEFNDLKEGKVLTLSIDEITPYDFETGK